MITPAQLLAGTDTLEVGGDPEARHFYYLYDFTTILPDTQGTLSIVDITTTERQSQFIPYHKEIMCETPGISKYWHQATIQNTLPTPINYWFFSD